ncbi:MAG: tyrosine--tRNA ligase [Dehalococcoidia bacterium]|nr:tyrosine--tRNA ligase [Dehalococcoidia bacterium]
MKRLSEKEFKKLFRRGVSQIINEEELIKMMQSGRPLRLKQGFDPSFTDIHMGHVVGLRKLRQFQQLGHQVVLIVGDWTARIGDPTGRSATRPMLTAEQVKANAQTYMEQFFKIVDKERTEVRWQSPWFEKGIFGLEDIIRLTSKFTVAQFLAREDFARRYAEGHPIAITEFLYPLMQGYDSVMIEADVEFGGTDQVFNCMVGRQLQEMVGQKPQQVFLMPLLVGTDGAQKMSKSLGNYIGVTDPPAEMFGKTMSINDSMIIPYLELLTDVPDEEIEHFSAGMADGRLNPMTVKKRLSHELVKDFWSAKAAEDAADEFARTVQKKEVPDEIPVLKVAVGLTALLSAELSRAGLVKSRSEARRLLEQKAIEINGKTVNEDLEMDKIEDGSVIKVGKRRFIKIEIINSKL